MERKYTITVTMPDGTDEEDAGGELWETFSRALTRENSPYEVTEMSSEWQEA